MANVHHFNRTVKVTEVTEPCPKCGGTIRYVESKKCTGCIRKRKQENGEYQTDPKFTARRRQVEFERDLRNLIQEWDDYDV